MRFLPPLLFAVLLSVDLAAQDRRRQPLEIKSNSTQHDVTYCTNGGVALKLDLYFPKIDENKNAPVAVYIHGGGWQKGDKRGGSWLASVANDLLSRGYIIAAVQYRLAPDHKWPAFIHDCKAAVRFLRENAKKYRIDANRIGAWGTSAGGHLVAMLGAADESAGLEGQHYLNQSSRVQAVVEFFGPSDLTVLVKDPEHAHRRTLVFGDERAVKEASPVKYVSKDDPPFLIVHGEEDALVHPKQAQILYDKLKETGVPAKLVMVKNGTHGLAKGDLSPGKDEILKMIGEFFDEHLRTKK